jgi:lysophospholipid acyltransferase (LPLAT)-like uncharacterized protein
MSQKTKTNIVLVEIKPTKYWQFNSWDKFKLPKPFGIIRYYAKKISIENMELEEAREHIKQGLLRYED